MDFTYMPSEIARLVYGYFIDVGCENTAKKFLEESPFLKEFSDGLKRGLRYTTKINNESLLQLMNAQMLKINNDNTLDDTNSKHLSNVSQSDIHDATLMNLFKTDFITKVTDSFEKVLEKSLEESLNTSQNRNYLSTPKPKGTPRNVRFSTTSIAQTPRRKSATPKRLSQNYHHSISRSPFHNRDLSQQNNVHNTNNVESPSMFSSPISSSVCESSELDIIVQPQLIYDELLKFMPLQEKLANKINQKVIMDNKDMLNSNEIVNQETEKPNSETVKSASPENKIGNIEKDLIPLETLGEIINSIEEEPEFNKFVEMVIEKEIASTPFKLFGQMTPSSTGTSVSSLNTPFIAVTPNVVPKNDSNYKADTLPVVKNLLNDWKTPVKSNDSMSSQNSFETTLTKDNTKINNGDIKVNPSSNQVCSTSVSNHILSLSNKIVPNANQAYSVQKEKKNLERHPQMKPVFQNQHLYTQRKLNKLKNYQKEVHDAMNYVPVDVDFSRNTSSEPQAEENKLTTVIEEVKPPMEPKPIELFYSSWPTLNQPIILQNQAPLLTNNESIILTTVPNRDQQLYYLNDGAAYILNCPNTIQTTTITEPIINNVSQSTSLSMPIINNFTTANSLLNVSEQSSKTTVADTANQVVSKVPSVSKSPARLMPAILSKGKSKKQVPSLENENSVLSENQNTTSIKSNCSQVLTETNGDSGINSVLNSSNNNKEQTKVLKKESRKSDHSVLANSKRELEKEDNIKIRKKRKSTIDNGESAEKTKVKRISTDSNEKAKNSRYSIATNDQKIKKLIDTDFEKFLGHLHGNSTTANDSMKSRKTKK